MDNDLSETRGLPKTFPVATFLGITFISQSDGNAVAEFRAGAQHANPMGTLHGGILCDLADAAMGIAFASTLRLDESFTTLELKINFLRPVWNGLLRAEAGVVSRGRTVGELLRQGLGQIILSRLVLRPPVHSVRGCTHRRKVVKLMCDIGQNYGFPCAFVTREEKSWGFTSCVASLPSSVPAVLLAPRST